MAPLKDKAAQWYSVWYGRTLYDGKCNISMVSAAKKKKALVSQDQVQDSEEGMKFTVGFQHISQHSQSYFLSPLTIWGCSDREAWFLHLSLYREYGRISDIYSYH